VRARAAVPIDSLLVGGLALRFYCWIAGWLSVAASQHDSLQFKPFFTMV